MYKYKTNKMENTLTKNNETYVPNSKTTNIGSEK